MKLKNGKKDYISAKEAAEILEIKPATLYSYVSRGWLKKAPAPGRKSQYLRSDVERLKRRSRARSGHGAVAGAALRWGQPSVETRITAITPDGHYYRGISALEMVDENADFAEFCSHLWDVDSALLSTAITRPKSLDFDLQLLRHCLPHPASPIDILKMALTLTASHQEMPSTFRRQKAFQMGLRLIKQLAAILAVNGGKNAVEGALQAESIAQILCQALLGQENSRITPLLNQTLILSADHGMSTSAFTARIVASTQADIYACLQSALHSFSGVEHGGACARVEAFLSAMQAAPNPEGILLARLNRGEAIPGFDHPLYPQGDPRAFKLLDMARAYAPNHPLSELGQRIVDNMREIQGSHPTLDFSLVIFKMVLGLPRGSAESLFALGRFAGWIAHIEEQKEGGFLLRPTSKYIGPHAEHLFNPSQD